LATISTKKVSRTTECRAYSDTDDSDLARIAALGANVYSFSLFWTRIYPFGSADSPVNQAGLDFYKNLTDYAWSLGIEPVA
jgi:beta-glucosidase